MGRTDFCINSGLRVNHSNALNILPISLPVHIVHWILINWARASECKSFSRTTHVYRETTIMRTTNSIKPNNSTKQQFYSELIRSRVHCLVWLSCDSSTHNIFAKKTQRTDKSERERDGRKGNAYLTENPKINVSIISSFIFDFNRPLCRPYDRDWSYGKLVFNLSQKSILIPNVTPRSSRYAICTTNWKAPSNVISLCLHWFGWKVVWIIAASQDIWYVYASSRSQCIFISIQFEARREWIRLRVCTLYVCWCAKKQNMRGRHAALLKMSSSQFSANIWVIQNGRRLLCLYTNLINIKSCFTFILNCFVYRTMISNCQSPHISNVRHTTFNGW